MTLPLQPLRSVAPVLAALLQSVEADGAAPGIVADWIEENAIEPADVLLLYARDKPACAGLEEMGCPTCGHQPREGALRHRKGDPQGCPQCGPEGIVPSGIRWCNLWELLPCPFPQRVLAEWAGRVYGDERAEAVTAFARQLWGPGDHAQFRSAIREQKWRTLRLFPEVTRQVPGSGDPYGDDNRPVMGNPDLRPAKVLRAEDFVPAEPGPAWTATGREQSIGRPGFSSQAVQMVAHGSIRFGDNVASDPLGRLVPHGPHPEWDKIGVAVSNPDENGMILVRLNDPTRPPYARPTATNTITLPHPSEVTFNGVSLGTCSRPPKIVQPRRRREKRS
jgi:hypothetical protein